MWVTYVQLIFVWIGLLNFSEKRFLLDAYRLFVYFLRVVAISNSLRLFSVFEKWGDPTDFNFSVFVHNQSYIVLLSEVCNDHPRILPRR